MEATDPSSAATSTLATDYAPDIPKNDGIFTQPSATTAMTTGVSGSHGSARRVRINAPAANDNEQSTDDGVDVYHDERSDHFMLTSPEAGRSDSATHADAVQGVNTASLFRLPDGQLITSKNTIPSHNNRVDADQGGKDTNLYRLPDGQEVTAKNTLQSHDVHNRRHQQVGSDNNANIPIPIFVDAYPQPISVRGRDNDNPLTPIFIAQAAVENGPALNAGAASSNSGVANSNGANLVIRHRKGYTRLAVAVIVVGLLVTVTVLVTFQLTGSDAPKSEQPPSQPAAKVTEPLSQSIPFLPQQSPTPAPTQTSLQSPTLSPTLESRATSITNFINDIKLSNGTLAVPLSPPTFVLSTSAEEAALAWLVYEDPLQLSPGTSMSEFRLQQRYALLTLFLQIPDFSTERAAESECEWLFTKSCSETTEPMAHLTGIETHSKMTSLGATLPPDLGLLTNLKSFSLSNSGLTGDLPSSLGTTWTNLTRLDMSGNALTGSLPSTLGMTWTNLATFDVSWNALTGSLPSSLGTAWTNLESFDVSGNALTGSLPVSLGTTWTNLEDFDVSQNDLEGAIPNALASNWNNLQEAYFYNNSLVGSIPSRYCSIANLTLLADCQEIACSCCTYCCSDSGEATRVAAYRCAKFGENLY